MALPARVRFRVCWLLVQLCQLSNVAFALVATSGASRAGALGCVREHVAHLDPARLAASRGLELSRGRVAACRTSWLCGSRYVAVDSRSTAPSTMYRPLLAPTTRPRISTPFAQWRHYFDINGLFGAWGPLFEVEFHVRQLVELLLQTIQAYPLSRAVPRVWINRCIVAMIIINAFSTSIIVRLTKSSCSPSTRLVTLIVDLLLDFGISVIIPLCVVMPRVLAFDFASGGSHKSSFMTMSGSPPPSQRRDRCSLPAPSTLSRHSCLLFSNY